MILGMSFATFTWVHVILSLIGIAAGLVVVAQMLNNARLGRWNALFLAATILTSVTAFMFPFFRGVGAPHIVGAISLVALAVAVALLALYRGHLSGTWRWIYVVAAVVALYLNVFVGVVQAFAKLAFLQPLAPTRTEPLYAIAQAAILAIFLVLGFLAVRRFRPL